MIVRPQKVYDFTAFARRQPTTPPPGDRIDAALANHADAIVAVQRAVEELKPEVDVKALAAEIVRLAAEFGDIRQQAINANAVIDQVRLEVARARADADRAREAADRAEARLAAAVEKAQAPTPGPREATLPTAILGPNTGGFYAGDDKGATATSADYAQVSIEWAEHMPDIIPPNILAINAISGDHWSSRWWASEAARIITSLGVIGVIGVGQGVFCEALTVTGPNACSNLTRTPAGPVMLLVNGLTFLPVGSPPPFAVIGQAINWVSSIYSLIPGQTNVAAWYPYAP